MSVGTSSGAEHIANPKVRDGTLFPRPYDPASRALRNCVICSPVLHHRFKLRIRQARFRDQLHASKISGRKSCRIERSDRIEPLPEAASDGFAHFDATTRRLRARGGRSKLAKEREAEKAESKAAPVLDASR